MSDSVLQSFLAEMRELPEFAGFSTVDVHTQGNWKSTPLHIAAVRGDTAAITALLDAGADIHARGEDGSTPLHDAVEQGHAEAVRHLLERGASAIITDDEGCTPICIAQLMKEHAIETLLREHTA